MKIGAIQKFSMIDYPGKLSAIIFTQGCNFRCPYCHNPELVQPNLFVKSLEEKQIFDFLKTRLNKLDAVCITGGEPTLHPDLPRFIAEIKALGFLVKLDTNGTNPAMLELLLKENLLDYIAMDIKAPLEEYRRVTKTEVEANTLRRSINLIEHGAAEYEFRSTLVSTLHTAQDVKKMAKSLGKAQKYFLQKFVPSKTLDASYLSETTLSDATFKDIIQTMQSEIELVEVR
ncbi:MAG: anaerobic ribonucleoside-triphosphate reductase activating protein [Candidatus Cloacimonadales bacterium]